MSEEREVAVLNRQFGSWTGDSLAIEDEAREDLVPIHNDFKQYVMSNYPLMGNIADSIINDPDFTQVIILHNMAEENNFQYVDTTIAYNRSTQSILSCVMGVLTGIGGVGSLYNQYVALFNGGASWSSVWTVLKSTIKRQFGWFTAAWAIYQIGDDCFDWW